MKTSSIVALGVVLFVLGAAAGTFFGGAGGAIGGSVAGACLAADTAVKEGLLTQAQASQLLQAIGSQ